MEAQKSNVTLGWSYTDWLATSEDDGYQYEILDGVLIKEPTPTTHHQAVVRNILDSLLHHLTPEQKRGLFVSPMGVKMADDQVLQPDVLYVRPARHKIIELQVVAGAPDVAFEILSPSTRERDLAAKRQIYALHSVLEYWVIDPRERVVHIFSEPEAGGYAKQITSSPGDSAFSAVLGWRVQVDRFFDLY